MNPTLCKTLPTAALVAAGLLWGSLSFAADSDDNLGKVRARVSSMFDAIDPEHVNTGPIDGWYKIQRGSIIAYVSADGRYLLQGDLIDLDTGVNLTDLSRNEARRELMATLDDDDLIRFTPADVKYRVNVFTDVGCTYCRRLHQQIDDYLAQGIEVRYLLYPRNGRSSKEWKTSEQVSCSADRNGALTAAKLDRKFQTSECESSMVADHYALGQQIGLSGTPAIVLEDGTLIAGYLPAAALGARLEQNQAQAAARR